MSLLYHVLLVATAAKFGDHLPAATRAGWEFSDGLRQQGDVFLRPIAVLDGNIFLLFLLGLGGLEGSSLLPLGLCLPSQSKLFLKELNLGGDIEVISGFDELDDFNDSVNLVFLVERVSLLALNPEPVEIGTGKCLCDECDQSLNAGLVGEVGSFLGGGGNLSLLLLGENCGFFFILNFPDGGSLGQLGFNFARTDFILFLLLFSLGLLQLLLNTRIVIVGIIDEPDDSGALRLLVLGADASVFILHVATLVPVLSLICVVLVILGELTPRLEIVPELVELFHVGQGHVLVTEVGCILVNRPPRVQVEALREDFVEVFCGELALLRDLVIEGERRVVLATLCRVHESLVGLLDRQPDLLVEFSKFVTKFVRMVPQSHFPVCFRDFFLVGIVGFFDHLEGTVQVAVQGVLLNLRL